MAEFLSIRLGSQFNDRIHWLITSANHQEIIAAGELNDAGQLSELSDKATTRKVTVFVPATDVALKQLKVPSNSARAMKLAAPYMLEDELAQDVEQMFFAFANVTDTTSEANCFIAAVEHPQMDLWLTWLKDADIKASKFIPDALALPLNDGAATVVQLGQQMLVRQGAWQAMTLDMVLWQHWYSNLTDEDNIELSHYSPLVIDNNAVKINPQPEELPLLLLAQNSHAVDFNLLQGEYKATENRSASFIQWRVAASLVAVVFLVNVITKVVTLNQLNTEQAALEQAIVSTYKKAFPETQKVRISSVRSQVINKLAELGGGSQDEHFLALLNKLQPAFTNVKNLTPETLKFDGKRKEVRLQLVAKSYQDFERFKAELEKQNLTVALGSQNNKDGEVSGSFSIKEG